MQGKVSRVVKNPYIFSTVSKLLVLFIGFFFTVVQTRYLGAVIKGQIAYVTSVTSITSIVLGFGIHQAYPYYRKSITEDILPIFVKLALAMLSVYAVLSVILTIWVDNIKIIAIILISPIMIYNKILSFITMVEEPNRKNSIEIVISSAELILICFLWLISPPSFYIGVIIVVFKDIVMALVYTLHWRKRVFSVSSSFVGWFLKLAKFGFFPMLALLMTTLNYRVDLIMLEGRVADAAIGVYSIGVMLAERMWLVPDAMKDVMISKITKGKGNNEVSFVIRICNTACLFVAIVIILIGKPFVSIVFGSEFAEAYEITLILLAGVFFMVYYKIIASYNIIIGRQFINFIFLGISVIGNIIANTILIPINGIYGAGEASVISYGICSFLFIVHFHRTTDIPISEMILVKISDLKKFKSKLSGIEELQ